MSTELGNIVENGIARSRDEVTLIVGMPNTVASELMGILEVDHVVSPCSQLGDGSGWRSDESKLEIFNHFAERARKAGGLLESFYWEEKDWMVLKAVARSKTGKALEELCRKYIGAIDEVHFFPPELPENEVLYVKRRRGVVGDNNDLAPEAICFVVQMSTAGVFAMDFIMTRLGY